MSDAVRNSTVWVFQAIAAQLGTEQETDALRSFRYGNADAGAAGDLRRFWLSGPLAISAEEQVDFLTRLRAGRLAASKQSQSRTATLLHMRRCGPGCDVYGKTGAVLPIDDDGVLRAGDVTLLPPGQERTGWFVGWVNRPNHEGGAVVFAHNLDLALPEAMNARTRVAFGILRANGLLPE